ncbi:putative splicing factor 3b subunit 10 [Diplodia seriata]|uniref:Putative splicing factor 3b subunit 10 n=1 Tax=Diplodia seriata TaxID=420778 RepID=A0A0G2HHY3_9PEZI|nr:putative splicing factor 3b subunit 10 [Diplodia seriata]
MADKLRTQQQLEQLQARYVGTGHADTSPFEFKTNYMRDYRASVVGHPELLQHTAIGMGVSRERVRLAQIEAMIVAAGHAPPSAQKTKTELYDDSEEVNKMTAKWAQDMGQKDKFTKMNFFNQARDDKKDPQEEASGAASKDGAHTEGQDDKKQK